MRRKRHMMNTNKPYRELAETDREHEYRLENDRLQYELQTLRSSRSIVNIALHSLKKIAIPAYIWVPCLNAMVIGHFFNSMSIADRAGAILAAIVASSIVWMRAIERYMMSMRGK